MGGIRLHPKYGLNPTLPVCIICGKDKGEIALLGAAYKEQAPMHMLVDVEPCDDCRKKYLSVGVLLLEVKEDKHTPTGTMSVIKTEAYNEIFKTPAPARHIVFVEEGLLARIGALDAQKGVSDGKTESNP